MAEAILLNLRIEIMDRVTVFFVLTVLCPRYIQYHPSFLSFFHFSKSQKQNSFPVSTEIEALAGGGQ